MMRKAAESGGAFGKGRLATTLAREVRRLRKEEERKADSDDRVTSRSYTPVSAGTGSRGEESATAATEAGGAFHAVRKERVDMQPHSSRDITRFALQRALSYGSAPPSAPTTQRQARPRTKDDGVPAPKLPQVESAPEQPQSSRDITRYALQRALSYSSSPPSPPTQRQARPNLKDDGVPVPRTPQVEFAPEQIYVRRGDEYIPKQVDQRYQDRKRRKARGLRATPTRGELIYERYRAEYIRNVEAQKAPTTASSNSRTDYLPGASDELSTTVDNITETDLYHAFTHPFRAPCKASDWRLGPPSQPNANPTKVNLRRLRFLERRFLPALNVYRSLVQRWRQHIWSALLGLSAHEQHHLGQVTILREQLARTAHDARARRVMGRPRLRQDPLWDEIVGDPVLKREALERRYGISGEEASVWWLARRKHMAHKTGRAPLSAARKALLEFAEAARREAEERGALIRKVENALGQWSDVARGAEREVWRVAMGVDVERSLLVMSARNRLDVGIGDVGMAVARFVTVRDAGKKRRLVKGWAELERLFNSLRTDPMRLHLLGVRLREKLEAHERGESHISHASLRVYEGLIRHIQSTISSLGPGSTKALLYRMIATQKLAERDIDRWTRELYHIYARTPPELHHEDLIISNRLLRAAADKYNASLSNEQTSAELARTQELVLANALRRMRKGTKRTAKVSEYAKPNNAMPELSYEPPAGEGYVTPFHDTAQEENAVRHDDDFPELPHEDTHTPPTHPLFHPTRKLRAPLKRIDHTDDDMPTAQGSSSDGKKLTHLKSSGEAHMVSITSKPATKRVATAIGTVFFSTPQTHTLVTTASLKKGDVLGIARIAGIQAAKMCPAIIPLCHPIMISSVDVDVSPFRHGGEAGECGIRIEAKVECTGPTGVEMEALTAVMGACLTVVDMVKAVDKSARIEGVKVVQKSGGKSGDWIDEEWARSKETT